MIEKVVPVSIMLRNFYVSHTGSNDDKDNEDSTSPQNMFQNRSRRRRPPPPLLLSTTLQIRTEDDVDGPKSESEHSVFLEEAKQQQKHHKIPPFPEDGDNSIVSERSEQFVDSCIAFNNKDKELQNEGLKIGEQEVHKNSAVIYSVEHGPALHPTWHHIHESLGIYNEHPVDPGLYKSMVAHVLVATKDLELKRKHYFSSLQQQDRHRFQKDTIDTDSTAINFDDCSEEEKTQPEPFNCVNRLSERNLSSLMELYPQKKKKPPNRTEPKEYFNRERNSSAIGIQTIATIHLHPTLLCQLPSPPSFDSVNGNQTYLPSSLPPNTLLVKFSDGSIRILPSLYKLLLKKKVITEKSSASLMKLLEKDRIAENKRTIRFSDDTFNQLSCDTYNAGIEKGIIQSAPVSHKVFKVSDNSTANARKENEILPRNNNYENILRSSVFDDVWGSEQNTFGDGVSEGNEVGAFGKEKQLTSDSNNNPIEVSLHNLKSDDSSAISFDERPIIDYNNLYQDEQRTNKEGNMLLMHQLNYSENQTRIEDQNICFSTLTIQKLKETLKLEHQALASSEELMKEGIIKLKALNDDIVGIGNQISSIENECRREKDNLFRTEFFLGLRQSKLLRELLRVYPIQSISLNKYAIRNLEIPSNLSSSFYNSEYDDAHLSSALGFLCHFVQLCSKYLCTPLRYRLICNASRSAIQDGGKLYPLFKDRVEKEQFETAMEFLGADVDCLFVLGRRNNKLDLGKLRGMNILEKLIFLFQSYMIIDAADKSTPTNADHSV